MARPKANGRPKKKTAKTKRAKPIKVTTENVANALDVLAEAVEAKHPGGRPTDYDPDYPRQAEQLCKLGATDDELAEFFCVSVRTINRWKVTHAEFCHSVRIGKEYCDDRVERSLYQMGVGAYVKEQQAIKVKVDQFEERVELVEVEKYHPPQATAAQFWLKNRRKEQWNGAENVNLSGTVETKGEVGNMELARWVAYILAKAENEKQAA